MINFCIYMCVYICVYVYVIARAGMKFGINFTSCSENGNFAQRVKFITPASGFTTIASFF